ncbi:MAG TPA: hypothetical protein PLC89_11095 [Haliscomenobacter sp.]|uniref:hypothetical protein n=1 Tax=Haliscomenobacter sp. TaxID=2717303 RepID=UPI002B934D1A|nr:hypothetical protein [Haliscomenobacter sp.]HOY17836.1 hypothetical protein [Haliscomenobacter sp.]HPH17267.1 hypothetical protein [Haliscomenobacter sp.]
MSSIHYFQRYSQPENVATNNTLLLLSRLYHDSPNKFKGFLNDLLDDNDLEAGIQFNQQRKGKGSVPDGNLSQVSFKVVVETKLHKHFSLQQLTEHLNSFGTEQHQVLLSLSPKQPDNSLKLQIETAISNFNTNHKTSIKYLPTTFQEIVTKFNNSLEDHNYELIEIIDDFEAYCIHDRLISDEEARMRVVTCGWTLQENFQFNLYYDSADRGYSDHNYLGIYSDKAVKGIGKIENIITANLLPTGLLDIIDKTTTVTQKQEQSIIEVISVAQINNNWDISTGHKFFCVEQFYPTNYRKTTKYPLQGTKFFNLKERLQVSTLPSTQDIAQRLNQLEW